MPEINHELADKVLSADLRNIIKKVSDGGTLSPSEREMMERYLATGVAEEDLIKARKAALIRRWAIGSKLSKDELKEIQDYLPDGRSVARRVTSEHYHHPYRVYAERMGMKGKDAVRKLKRWVKIGRETPDGAPRKEPDLPPFDQLDQMASWWRRNMKWKVPDFLLDLEGGSSPATSTTVDSATTEEQEMQPISLRLGAEVESDLGLQQARALVEATFKQLQRALELGLVQQAMQLQRQWQQLVGTLRQWEKDIVKIQEGKGEVLRARVVSTELVSMFAVTAQSFTNTMIALVQELRPDLSPMERRAKVLPFRDQCFAHLKKTRFSQVWEAVQTKENDHD